MPRTWLHWVTRFPVPIFGDDYKESSMLRRSAPTSGQLSRSVAIAKPYESKEYSPTDSRCDSAADGNRRVRIPHYEADRAGSRMRRRNAVQILQAEGGTLPCRCARKFSEVP